LIAYHRSARAPPIVLVRFPMDSILAFSSTTSKAAAP
jgi:hypothetical protein